MQNATKIDLESVAKTLQLPLEKVQSAVELLEAGNTIPFITRYRKDESGGLGERQLRDIKSEVARQTAIAERRNFVLNAIENQGALTDELRQQLERASQSRQIEDLYRPFKPRKTSLAETARQQGLEPLARDILEGHQPDIDLASRATDFVRVDKGLTSVDEVIKGVQHILAERFGEHLQLRSQLRNLFWQSGKITTTLIQDVSSDSTPNQPSSSEPVTPDGQRVDTATDVTQIAAATPAGEVTSPSATPGEEAVSASQPAADAGETVTKENGDASQNSPAETKPDESAGESGTSGESVSDTVATPPVEATASDKAAAGMVAEGTSPAPKKKRKKKKKKKAKADPFAEFASYEESLQKIPPHRVLAINRGERAGKLKVRLTADSEKLEELATSSLVPEAHPFAEFLKTASEDAMQRLILPSIEREIRRDLTERSETHAVNVFARNLRQLFLQPPVRGHRILGIDPGYRSGCKVAVIDETGQPLGHGVFSIVGNAERIESNKQRLLDIINEHQPDLIAIGNGSGCRAVEQFVSDVISEKLSGRDIQYSIVNQAGTSAYSTSDIGQVDLPDHDPVIRSAISIARRLQDPLSELVKVNPANVGVGLYQHDIKAKHLADSLESVVESCVNYVGVNANTASPSLLRYVSGLGQTTARKLVEHRNENGPFQSRENLKEVSGFGDVTFVQSAGFLRIDRGSNALDQSSIHPEDYELANRILEKLGCAIQDLVLPPRTSRIVRKQEAAKTGTVGSSTGDGKVADTAAAESVADADVGSSEETVANGETNAPPTAASLAEGPADQNPGTTVATQADTTERRSRRRELVQKLRALDIASLAAEFEVGELKLKDLLRALRNPAQDPREDLPAPVFRKGILKFEDLKQGMQIRGQIVNVVDFGVFLNIGIGESCLVHISRLANRFVHDPHWYYSVGDVLPVWVQEVDPGKRRVTLTAIRPDSEKRERRRKPSGAAAGRGGAKRRGDSGRNFGSSTAGKGKRRHSAGRGKPHHKRPRKPKPVTPITDEMVEGKEPMRSFSDLLQFHKRKADDKESGKSD